MKIRAIAANDVFTVLLFGLPQGLLLSMVYIVYSAWMALTMRSSTSPPQFFNRLK
jgi:hypothetical protein